MAYSCPFIKGSAVYKARAIYQNLHPEAIIDTRTICLSGLSSKTTETEPEIILNDQVVSSSYRIYPNPVQEQLNIEWTVPQDAEAKVSVVDLSGKVLEQFSFQKGYQIKSIKLSNLASGVYMLLFHLNNHKIGHEKIIKE
jgi:CRISPR/Cas system-associated protein Cas7 (RAMP superfamily)